VKATVIALCCAGVGIVGSTIGLCLNNGVSLHDALNGFLTAGLVVSLGTLMFAGTEATT